MELGLKDMRFQDILILLDEEFNPKNICIVAGVGSSTGRAVALAAAANGLLVVGFDGDAESADETQQVIRKMGGRMEFIKADLKNDEEVVEAVRQAAELGCIKFLANVACMAKEAPLAEGPVEAFDTAHRLSLRAPFHLASLCIPHMRQSRDGTGVIGNLVELTPSSQGSHKAAMNVAFYGLRGLSQAISASGGGRIRSFSIKTGSTDGALQLACRESDLLMQHLSLETTPERDPLANVDIANLFVFGFSRFARHLFCGDLFFGAE